MGTPTTAPGRPAGPGSPVLPWAPGGPCRVKAKKYTLQNLYSNMIENSLKMSNTFKLLFLPGHQHLVLPDYPKKTNKHF